MRYFELWALFYGVFLRHEVISDTLCKNCPAECCMKKAAGTCDENKQSYFYNPSSAECEYFIYSGCGGNGNRFKTESQCMARCSSCTPTPIEPQEDCPALCKMSMSEGPCRAFIPAFYFNYKSGVCDKFIYGGCRGNQNRFFDESSCMSRCGKCVAGKFKA